MFVTCWTKFLLFPEAFTSSQENINCMVLLYYRHGPIICTPCMHPTFVIFIKCFYCWNKTLFDFVSFHSCKGDLLKGTSGRKKS